MDVGVEGGGLGGTAIERVVGAGSGVEGEKARRREQPQGRVKSRAKGGTSPSESPLTRQSKTAQVRHGSVGLYNVSIIHFLLSDFLPLSTSLPKTPENI